MSDKKIPSDARKRIGNIGLQDSFDQLLPLDDKERTAMRDELLNDYFKKRTTEVFKQRANHINGNREIAERLQFFFDDQGKPTENTTIDDIEKYKKRVETEINWLSALTNELKRELRTLEQLEKAAQEILDLNLPQEK